MDLDALTQDQGRECVNLRGEQIPFIRLSKIFALPEREQVLAGEAGDTNAGGIAISIGVLRFKERMLHLLQRHQPSLQCASS